MMIEISEKANVLVDEVLRQVEINRSKNEVSSYFYARIELDNYIATLEAENEALKAALDNRKWQRGHPEHENANLTARIAEFEEKQRWIPVSERLPEDLQSIIVFTKDRKTYIIRFLELYGREGFGSLSDIVTHWMPLPPNPESPNDAQTQTIVYGKESEE